MRRAATDSNQSDIVKALRQRLYSVRSLHKVGSGFPDLIVGTGTHNVLIEVKTKTGKAKGKTKLQQDEFFATWKGPKALVRSIDEALLFCSQYE